MWLNVRDGPASVTIFCQPLEIGNHLFGVQMTAFHGV